LQDKFKGKPIRILHGDFFEHTETYDLILEQTFFCALNPRLRERYAAKVFHLLNKGGRVVGLLFNVIFEKAGPPFGGKREDYIKIFEPIFNLKQFDICTNSVKPRMGMELFIEMEKKDLPAEFVKIYTVSGITCSGCVRSVTAQLLKVEGVTAISINNDFTEILVVSNQPVQLSKLRSALAYDTKYQLNETNI
jgi:copper chaperone CopZ